MATSFRTGEFDRKRVGRVLRPFCPVQAVDAITELNPAELARRGKRLIMLDVDNTLLEWKQESIPESTFAWIRAARDHGIELVLISNTRHPERLYRLAERMEIEVVRGKFKPSKDMFEQALAKFSVGPEQALMIGDQMFTDVFGANRSGVDAVWVKQMTPLDFVGTKYISRVGEKVVRRHLYRAILPPEGSELAESSAVGLLANPTVRQFVKFVMVGAVSTVVDLGLWWYFVWYFQVDGQIWAAQFGQSMLDQYPAIFTRIATRPEDGTVVANLAASPFIKVVSSGIAIFNSFLLNRRWTFKIRGQAERTRQLQKFYVVALVGLVLNTIIITSLSNIIPGHEKRSAAVAAAIATVVVAFWNFFGQKLWTFRKKELG